MEQQPGFDFARDEALSTPPVERVRLNRQCLEILALLEQRVATNLELSKIALKYTGRVSELRQAGYDVECYDRDRASGVCWYRLKGAA